MHLDFHKAFEAMNCDMLYMGFRQYDITWLVLEWINIHMRDKSVSAFIFEQK